MDTITTSVASSEELRSGAISAAEALGGPDGTAGISRVSVPLSPAVQEMVTKVTGGNAMLRWCLAAAATAVALRRLGAQGAVTVVSGEALGRAGVPVLLRLAPTMTFREWLGEVRTAAVEALAHGSRFEPDVPVVVDADHEASVELGAGHITAVSRRLAVATASVLQAGLTDPSRPIADIDGLDEDTRRRVVEDFNDIRDLDNSVPFRELVLAQAEQHPDAVAIHDDTDSFTYRDLCSRATAIAVILRQAGVTNDVPVALLAQRGAWSLVMAVGVLFAGGAYIPVDPALPGRRREHLLREAAVVVAEPGIEQAPGTTVAWLSVDDLRRADGCRDAAAARDLLGPPPDGGDLAYVMFTSGSTGTPKGVCIEHHSFLNLLATRVADYGLRAGVEIPQTAPITFDLSIWQMFAGLTVGATICLVPDDVVRDPGALAAMAADHGYECMALVPTFLAVLLSHFEDDPASAAGVRGTLRRMISTGELLSGELARRWHAVMPGVALLNAYGPAEVADDSTGGFVTDREDRYAPVGRTLPNVRVYVLDADLQPVPPDTIGEIFIGGESVGRGYSGEPAMTAAAFLPDPFARVPGTRMYRTGDQGLWRADGSVVLLGRIDSQVKIRGRRVELGEIEGVLETHPRVSRAVVELLRDDGLERLVAFVACSWDTTGLREFAAQRLPAFMVPHEVVILDQLPRNRNGKVDRKRLHAMAAERTVSYAGQVPPRDDLEKALCELWAARLKVDRVGIKDDFFELGGDSITGILIAQAACRQGIAMLPRHMMEHRTVEQLAETVRAAQAAPSGQEMTSTTPGGPDDREPAPLTPAQLAFLSRDVAQPDYWNHGVMYEIERSVGTAQIEHAVRTLAQRHPMLRARLVTGGQAVSPEMPPLTEFDLRGVGSREMEARLHTAATELHAALDLRDGPVCRVGVLRTSHGPSDRLVLVIHHMMVDLLSWNVLTDELLAILREGAQASLPPTGYSYTGWARRLADHGQSLTEADVGYWLGTDWASCVTIGDSRMRGTEGGTVEATSVLDREVLTPGRGTGLSLHERLLAAFGASVRDWLGVPGGTVQVQLGGHGREDLFGGVDVGNTVGYFNTAYPFALPMSGDPEQVAHALRSIPGRGLPFEAIRYLHPDLRLRERLAAIPVSPVLFNFWGTPDYLHHDGVRTDIAGQDRPADMDRQFLIELYPHLLDEQLRILWRFSGEAFSEERMHALVNAYVASLKGAR
jgi:amino acid adenylation domain-containing protein